MSRNSLNRNFLIIAVIVGTVALNNFIFDNPIQNGFHRFFSRPGSWLVRQAGLVKIIKEGWINAGNLTKENRLLKEENFLLESELAGRDTLERENQFLRRQLGVGSRLETELYLSRILGVNRTPASSTLVIDKGSKDGVEAGMAVITAGNVLVGLVKQVLEDSSVIWLVDDPRLAIDVMIQGANTLGRTRGLANGSFSVDLLSHTEEIKTGAPILTAGLGSINEALLVGEISSIGDGAGDLFRDVKAKSFFEVTSGASVFVITSHD